VNPQPYAAPCNSTDWVSFRSSASSGTVGPTYQWYFSNDDSFPGTAVTSTNRYFTGGTTTTLQVAPQATRYVWMVVTDACGATASSTHAQLFVPDPSTCP